MKKRGCLDPVGPVTYDEEASLPPMAAKLGRPSCELLWVVPPPRPGRDREGGSPVLGLQLEPAAPLIDSLKAIDFYFYADGTLRRLWVGKNGTNSEATWREIVRLLNEKTVHDKRYKVRLVERPNFPALPFNSTANGGIVFDASKPVVQDYKGGRLPRDRTNQEWTQRERENLVGPFEKRAVGDPFFPLSITDPRNHERALGFLASFEQVGKAIRTASAISAELYRMLDDGILASGSASHQVREDAKKAEFWLGRIGREKNGAKPTRPIKVKAPPTPDPTPAPTPSAPEVVAPKTTAGIFLEAFGGDLEAAKRALVLEAATRLRAEADKIEADG